MSDQVISLGALVEAGDLELGDGYRTKRSELGEPGLPILRVAEVHNGYIKPGFSDYVHESRREAMGPKTSRPGDIVLTTKGTVGRVAMIADDAPKFVYSPQVCFFRTSPNSGITRDYLYYWFKSTEFWEQAGVAKGQTDMADYLNLRDVRSLRMTLPSLSAQKATSQLLSALDDKIAVNERLAATAVELADERFAAAAFGLAFKEDTFGTAATVLGGGTPSTKVEEYWNGKLAWATPKDVTPLTSPYLFETGRAITDSGLENCNSQLYPENSIFMTSRATIGAFALPQQPTAVNQGFIVVLPPNEEMRWWLFHEMRSRVDEMISLANGSTFLELSRKNFKAMRIRKPDTTTLVSFAETAGPLHERAAQAADESRTLATLRDTLLPQLMSGKLRVRDAERIVEDAV